MTRDEKKNVKEVADGPEGEWIAGSRGQRRDRDAERVTWPGRTGPLGCDDEVIGNKRKKTSVKTEDRKTIGNVGLSRSRPARHEHGTWSPAK